MQPDFPLTRFLCDLNEASMERVRAMQVDKAARHYGIEPKYVKGYRAMTLGITTQEKAA